MYLTHKEKLLQLLKQYLYLTTSEIYKALDYNFPLSTLVNRQKLGCSIVDGKHYYFLLANYCFLPERFQQCMVIPRSVVKPVVSYNRQTIINFVGYEYIGNIWYPRFDTQPLGVFRISKSRSVSNHLSQKERDHLRYLKNRSKILARCKVYKRLVQNPREEQYKQNLINNTLKEFGYC